MKNILESLIRIKNAQAVKKETVKLNFSKMGMSILELLKKHGYLDAVKNVTKKNMEVKLKYKNGIGVIHGIKILSRPSRNLYIGYKEIRPVKQGFGLLVLSTPKGIIDGKTAKKSKMGGQILFEIW
ncbi:MAG: 30S ribosomal protein S8 [Candidatus Pacebacteria bacterium]|nr:30S ribosomal protein S8 [Candidatus Paceibacterota bacterium]